MTRPAKRPHSLPRRIFRWFRIGVLLIVLTFVTLVLWSNYLSVPEFIAARVRAELRRNNVALDFRRLHLSGFKRIVAEHLSIAPVDRNNRSRIEISQGELKLRYSGIARDPVAISGLRLNGGQLSLAVSEPGEPARFFSITNLHADIEFKPGDTLRIVNLSGQAFGAKADVSGALHNFSQFRLAETPPGKEGSQWRKQLRDIVEIAQQLSFATPPQLTLSFNTDAADLSLTRAAASLRADQGTSRWGSFRRLRLNSSLSPLTNEPALNGTFEFHLEDLRSESANLSAIHLEAQTRWSTNMQQLLTNNIALSVSGARAGSISAPEVHANLSSRSQKDKIVSRLTFNTKELRLGETQIHDGTLLVTLDHDLPFPPPARLVSSMLSSAPATRTNHQTQQLSGKWELRTAATVLPRAQAESINASGEILAKATDIQDDPSLSFWNFARAFELPWQLQLSNLTAGDAKIGNLATQGRWLFPSLTVAQCNADLYNGKLNGRAELDVVSRRLTAFAETTFDYHQASVLLDPPVQRWLEQFAWENPPFVQTEFTVRVPPWTSSWEKLEREILPTLGMNGRFEGRGSFRGIPLGLAQSHFTFTNFIWTLPDLQITRPEGKAFLTYAGNVTNQEISARLESQIDPTIVASAFDKNFKPAFDFVRFSTPPLIKAEIHGDLDDLATVTARGSIAATNFFAKEQAFSDLRTDFLYNNQTIQLTDLTAHRGREQVQAPFSLINFPAEVMFVSNVVSTIDPYIAMSIVGNDAYDAIDPYRFANSPTVIVNGFVPLQHVTTADLHFHVSGTEFTFWRFHLPELSGDVYWKAFQVSFSNVYGAFYNGKAEWSGQFDIDPGPTDNAHFSFHGSATNASLRPLVHDLFNVTNRLEGIFSGDLVITSANSTNIQSWDGYGHANLKDGYLWSIPVFGVFSPALETLAPGLGTSPVSSGAGDFTITNSVTYTKDLQVRAPAFRLDYKGNVDLSGKLDARVEAEILRDTWLVGKVFSAALWPLSKAFEARVSGTLNQPKTHFRYFPRALFAPFRAMSDAAKRKEQKTAPVPSEAAPPAQ